MKHILFSQDTTKLSLAILVKETNLDKERLLKNYVNSLLTLGLEQENIIAFNLKYDSPKKVSASYAKEYLNSLLSAISSLNVTTILVADASYFKFLTGVSKTEQQWGYVLPCKVKGFEYIKCVLSLNDAQLFYDPSLQFKLDLSINTAYSSLKGIAVEIGSNIIKTEAYPDTIEEIALWLDRLHQYDALTVDIEAFSLDFYDAGIGTIAFAWNEHDGIAFCVDYFSVPYTMFHPFYGTQLYNKDIKKLLIKFFKTYKGKLIYHNIGYDAKVLLYELFMDNLLDQKGLLYGLEVITKNIDDTKLITYLATNSCAGNTLGLKPNTHEYSGNYSVDVTDIRSVPKQDLLRYNLVDALSTWYLYKKNYPIMVADNQLDIYNTIFIPSVKVILQMELTGLCLSMDQVLKAEQELITIKNIQLAQIQDNPLIKQLEETLTNQAWLKDFEDRKAKAKKPENIKPRDIPKQVIFNPGSGKHLIELIYKQLNLEVTDLTDTKLPATGAKVLLKKYNQMLSEFNLTDDDLKLDDSLIELFNDSDLQE